MSALRDQIIAELNEKVAARMRRINAAAASGMKGVGFDWGDAFDELLSAGTSLYVNKETAKTQAKYADQLASAEAKKMLALTELELAKAKTTAEQSVLTQKQNELQKLIAEMEFSNVKKYIYLGAGSIALIFGAIKLREMWVTKKRARGV